MADHAAFGPLAAGLNDAHGDTRGTRGDDGIRGSRVIDLGEQIDLEVRKAGSETASFRLEANVRRARVASGVSPIAVSAGHAASTYSRNLASALGAGSLATTSNPLARYCAAQLAPMRPVPTIAMRRTGLFEDMIGFSFRGECDCRVQKCRYASLD